MTALPFEVLVIIFKNLEFKDLKQCQFVSKLWNQASLKQVYSDIKINTDEKSSLYVRTLKNSTQLGKYLETITIGGILEKEEESIVWDKHGLLDTIINHCPNLLNIRHLISSSPFWTKLVYAASQGRLSRLQYISEPWEEKDYDYYAYTALAFKNTLTTINLPDYAYGADGVLESEAYPILYSNLNQFPCLQNLSVSYGSIKPLSHYDPLIEDCKHLKQLSIYSSEHYEDIQGIVLPEINPRPDIFDFDCKWMCIKEDDQLNYVMQKFPNLKALSVHCDEFDGEYIERNSPDVLLQFLHFAINIKKVYLEMLLNQEECIKVWADAINKKCKKMELKISVLNPRQFEEGMVSVKFNNRTGLELQFLPASNFVSLYCQFLAKSGKTIQRLNLKFFRSGSTYPDETFHTIQNIFSAIELCPSLQHFELEYLHDLPFDESITYRHAEVKSIKLIRALNKSSIGIFKNMSLIFPNLKEMEFGNYLRKYGKSEATIITMPYTSLDILKWKYKHIEYSVDDFEVYIRLNTNSGETFYVTSGEEISSIGSNHYNRLRTSEDCYLDITCQNLTKLQINDFTYEL